LGVKEEKVSMVLRKRKKQIERLGELTYEDQTVNLTLRRSKFVVSFLIQS
jgi:hypothetical protein